MSSSTPSYCWACGESLDPSANFCPSCGGTVSRTSGHSLATATNERASIPERDVLEYRISTALEAGWEVEEDLADHVVMVRRDAGSVGMHVLIGLTTIWWTMGLGNGLYAAYRYFGQPERMVLEVDSTDGATNRFSIVTAAMVAGLFWVAGAAFFFFALEASGALATAAFHTLGFFSLVLGTICLPSINRRWNERGPITEVGRRFSVHERTVHGAAEPCSVCSGRVGRGVEREYREDLTLLGFPLRRDRGSNYYCRACANAESAPRGSTATKRSEADDADADAEPAFEAENGGS